MNGRNRAGTRSDATPHGCWASGGLGHESKRKLDRPRSKRSGVFLASLGKDLAVKVYRIPIPTNVETVSLAAGHKRLVHRLDRSRSRDRSEVERVIGFSPARRCSWRIAHVVVDSTEILRYLEARTPDPPLFPREPSRRAAVVIFLDWITASASPGERDRSLPAQRSTGGRAHRLARPRADCCARHLRESPHRTGLSLRPVLERLHAPPSRSSSMRSSPTSARRRRTS